MRRVGLQAAALCVAMSAFGGDGPCEGPPDDAQGRRHGTLTCYWDTEKKHKQSTTEYVAGNEVGPSRRWREDGTLEEVNHLKPNLKEYATRELYYETGGIQRADFSSPNSNVMVEFTVSGRIKKLSCLPGAKGGYAYSVEECQPKISFDLKSWRPGK